MLDTNRKKGIVIMIVFCIVWTGFFLYGIVGTVKAMSVQNDLKKNGVEVQGICEHGWTETSVEQDENGHSETHHSYYANVSYDYNGQTYYKEKLSVRQEYSQGDYVNLYVLPSDPEVAVNYFSSIFWYVLTIIGLLVFVFAGIGVTVFVIKAYILRGSAANQPPQVMQSARMYTNDDYAIFNSADRNKRH